MEHSQKVFTVKWTVENYTHCPTEVKSPHFVVDALENIRWRVVLHPIRTSETQCVGITLNRLSYGSGDVDVAFEASFLTSEGKVVGEIRSEPSYWPIHHDVDPLFNDNFAVLVRRVESLDKSTVASLPDGTLVIVVKMLRDEGSQMDVGELTARTRVKVEKTEHSWKVFNFSRLKSPSQRHTRVPSASDGDVAVDVNLSLAKYQKHVTAVVLEVRNYRYMNIFAYDMYIRAASGNQLKFASGSYQGFVDMPEAIMLPMTKQEILAKRDKFLVDDTLCLDFLFFGCEGKMALNEIVEMRNYDEWNPFRKPVAPPPPRTTMADDVYAMYLDKTLCDRELKTRTRSFPVHSFMLASRSAVFRAMFTVDMKDRHQQTVSLPHMDDATASDMLQYVYHDAVDDLDWDRASRLYAAADQYQILGLARLCSEFLLEHLSVSNACSALALADTHHDPKLKRPVRDFIKQHRTVVMASEEWKHMEKEKRDLVIETFREIFLNE